MSNGKQIIDFTWHGGDLNSFLPIFFTTLFFVVYWFTASSDKIKDWFYNRYDFDKASVLHISFKRIFGFVVLGIIPALLSLIFLKDYSLSSLGVSLKISNPLFIIGWTLGLSAILMPLAYISAQKTKNLANYPQIRAKKWNKRVVVINTLTWALYLLGYEFLFRGLLLFPLVGQLGVWPAIAVNIAMYSTTHIPKGLEETIGAIPLSLVLCYLTLASGTIWIAFMVHLIMALTNSFTALKFHPEIHYKRN